MKHVHNIYIPPLLHKSVNLCNLGIFLGGEGQRGNFAPLKMPLPPELSSKSMIKLIHFNSNIIHLYQLNSYSRIKRFFLAFYSTCQQPACRVVSIQMIKFYPFYICKSQFAPLNLFSRKSLSNESQTHLNNKSIYWICKNLPSKHQN